MDVNGCKWCLIPSLRTESIPLNRRQNPHLWMSASVTDHFIGQVVMLEGIILRCSRCLNSLKPPFFAGEILQILAFKGQICIFFLDFLGESPGFSMDFSLVQAASHWDPSRVSPQSSSLFWSIECPRPRGNGRSSSRASACRVWS